MLRPLLYVIGTLLVTQAAVIATSVYLHRGLAHRALNLHPSRTGSSASFSGSRPGRIGASGWRCTASITPSPTPSGIPTARSCTASGRSSSGTSITTCARPATPRRSPAGPRTSGTTCGIACSSTRARSAGCSASPRPCWSSAPSGGCSWRVSHFVLYVFVLAPSINGLGHWWGRRNFGNNSATNLRVLAWLTGGESLHNNHHAYPSSPKFSMGRFEFDPSWVVIRVLTRLGLVRLLGDTVRRCGRCSS